MAIFGGKKGKPASEAKLSPQEQFAAAWPGIPTGYASMIRARYTDDVAAFARANGVPEERFSEIYFWAGALAMNALTAAPAGAPTPDFDRFFDSVVAAVGPGAEAVRPHFQLKVQALRNTR